VDDEKQVRDVTRLLLRKFGMETVEAADGVSGLEAIRANLHREPVVLLDLTMPNMGGAETLRRLREFSAGTRVVLMSGYSANDVPAGAGWAGADGFLPKPFSADQLHGALSGAMVRRAAA
jgi:CheY-like chemotaxis protein